MSEVTTFVDACLAGDAVLSDIDDWIDTWHDAPPSSSAAALPIAGYLGMSDGEYATWVERPESLRFVIAGRKAHTSSSKAEMLGGLVAAAARADNDVEAAGVLQWLKDTGRL